MLLLASPSAKPTPLWMRKQMPPRHTPWIRVVIFTVLFVITWWSYGKSHFCRNKHGMFYDPEVAYERRYGLHREHEARNYLQHALQRQKHTYVGATPDLLLKRNHNSDFCAVIVTYGQGHNTGTHPLELSIGSIFAGLTKKERNDLDLRIYIANTQPSAHPLYHSSVLTLAHKIVSAEDVANQTVLEELAKLDQLRAYVEKTAWDYSLAIEHCYLNSTAPYIVLFEGDVLAADSWLARSKLAIQDADRLSADHGKPWLDLRLFNPASEIRWNAFTMSPAKHIAIKIIEPLLIVVLSAQLYLLFISWRRRRIGRHVPSETMMRVICILTIPLFVWIYYATSNLRTVQRPAGVSTQYWGSCTQGTIFQRHHVPLLVSELQNNAPKTPADMSIWRYARDTDMLRMVVDPPMVQHLGYKGSWDPGSRSEDPTSLPWSAAFEDLDSQKLEQEHHDMVKRLYG